VICRRHLASAAAATHVGTSEELTDPGCLILRVVRDDVLVPRTRTGEDGQVGAPAGRLADGTPYFGRLGEMAYDHEADLAQCHLCGRWLRSVGGTHTRVHGWTLASYRAAFELRENVPTCAPGVSRKLRGHAKRRLGERGFASPSGAGGSLRSTPGWRSLARVRPALAGELHSARNGQLKPADMAVGSKRKVWWLCASCGFEWQATVGNRALRGSGCPRCAAQHRAERRARVGPERSLAVLRPDLYSELARQRNDGVELKSLAVHASRRVWWHCPRCSHEWEATPANRARGTGCPVCWSNRRGASARVVRHERALAVVKPGLAAELVPELNPGVDARRIGAGSDQRLWWRCGTCAHVWRARVADRSAGTGCPICHRKRQWRD
jgi:rubrerythrin